MNLSGNLSRHVHGEVPEAYYPLWATSEPSVYPTRDLSTREKRALQPTSFDSAKGQQATFNISDASPDSAAGKFSAISRLRVPPATLALRFLTLAVTAPAHHHGANSLSQ